jgi:hypothetical protein
MGVRRVNVRLLERAHVVLCPGRQRKKIWTRRTLVRRGRLTAGEFRLGDRSKRWGTRRGRHTLHALPRALSDQERHRHRRHERGELTGSEDVERMMPTNGLETASRQDTHYRRTDGSAETRRRPTPLRLLHLTRLAKGQGLLKGRCAENAETARPTVASRACFRRTPANCSAVGG